MLEEIDRASTYGTTTNVTLEMQILQEELSYHGHELEDRFEVR